MLVFVLRSQVCKHLENKSRADSSSSVRAKYKIKLVSVLRKSKSLENSLRKTDTALISFSKQILGKDIELDKCDEVNWFSINQLHDNIVPPVRHAIEQY